MSIDVSASAAYVATPTVSTRGAATPSTTGQAVASIVSNVAAAPRPSPVSLLDPSTGLVVLEFYNAKGTETASLPTKKALENYRLNEVSNSVFQPAIHDGTVPQPPTSDKPSGAVTSNSTNAVQASGGAVVVTAAASGSSSASFTTHA